MSIDLRDWLSDHFDHYEEQDAELTAALQGVFRDWMTRHNLTPTFWLKDCPMKGDTAGWREVFATLEWLEHQRLVVIERSGRSIESLILTDAGADRIRANLDEERGLFASL